MFDIIEKGTREAIKAIEKDAKQMRFAGALTLTRLGNEAKKEIEKEIRDTFENPTPFTQRSVKFTKATPKKLEASVSIKPITAQYIAHHVKKQARLSKGFEQALRAKGLLPSNMYAVPGPGVRLNQYGNVGRAMIRKIVEGATTRGGKYFIATIRGFTGIWQRYGRKGRQVKPVLLFVPKPSYQPEFDFYGTAERVFKNNFEREFNKALKYALRTAK